LNRGVGNRAVSKKLSKSQNVLPQFFPQLITSFRSQQFDASNTRCGLSRRRRCGEHEAPSPIRDQVDQLGTGSDEASSRTRRLAKSRHSYVHDIFQTQFGNLPSTPGTNHSERMGFVDQQECAVSFR